MAKINFLSSMSQDLSEIILIWRFCAKETFLIIINVWNSCSCSYFCGNCDTFFQDSSMNRNVKRTAIFWNIINVFTVTFNQFNAPLNKSNFLNELYPKPLNSSVRFKCKSLLVAVLFSSKCHSVCSFTCTNYKQMPKITNYISSFHFIIPSDIHSSSFIPCLLPEICFLSQVILLIIKTMLTHFSVPSLHHPICGWVC